LSASPEDLSAEIRRLTEQAERLHEVLGTQRTPSKASQIGPGFAPSDTASADHFFATVARANSAKLAGGYDASITAKADLEAMGSHWADPDVEAKATVGDTDAAGGYLVPNAVVADINLQATPRRGVVDLFQNINGVRGAAVDVPWEQETISRAVIALPGATKENSNPRPDLRRRQPVAASIAGCCRAARALQAGAGDCTGD
jgi:HK97 family phage major capsid protein